MLQDGEFQVELSPELLVPLLDQGCRHQDQGPLHEAAEQIFLEHQPCLDRLPQAHLVREERPAPHPTKHGDGGLDLMLVLLDIPEPIDAEEPIEAAVERVALDPQPDLVILCRVVGADRETLEQLLRPGSDPELPSRREFRAEPKRGRGRRRRDGWSRGRAAGTPRRLERIEGREPSDAVGERDLEHLEAVALTNLDDQSLTERAVDHAIPDAESHRPQPSTFPRHESSQVSPSLGMRVHSL